MCALIAHSCPSRYAKHPVDATAVHSLHLENVPCIKFMCLQSILHKDSPIYSRISSSCLWDLHLRALWSRLIRHCMSFIFFKTAGLILESVSQRGTRTRPASGRVSTSARTSTWGPRCSGRLLPPSSFHVMGCLQSFQEPH